MNSDGFRFHQNHQQNDFQSLGRNPHSFRLKTVQLRHEQGNVYKKALNWLAFGAKSSTDPIEEKLEIVLREFVGEDVLVRFVYQKIF